MALTVKRFPQLFFIFLACSLLSACAQHIFHPNSRMWQNTPINIGYTYKNHFIKANDGVLLNFWQVKTQHKKPLGAVLYFHGNSHNISAHLPQIAWLLEAGYDVVMPDYRGFGASQGQLSLAKSADDMQQVMAWFLYHYDGESTWLLGQSLGAALSAYVAGHDKTLRHAFNGVILDSGFSSFRSIGQDVFARSWFTWAAQHPLSWFMPKGYDAKTHIAKFSPTPLLMLHSKEDTIVPYYHGEALYKAAKEPKALITYGGWHVQGFKTKEVREQVFAFMRASAKQ